MRNLAAAGLLFIAIPAWAGESLINGQALEYNRAYRCNGERVIVAHCRDTDDQSYCQLVYPDRPYQNGMQVEPVEMRGDIIGKLNSCGKAVSAPAPSPVSAPAAKPTSNYASTGRPPGVGKASWDLLDMDEKDATFFTKARIKRTGHSADGWFTLVYVQPKDIAGTQITGARYFQMHYLANCAKGTVRLSEAAYLDEDGKLLSGGFVTEAEAPFTRPAQGTIGGEQFNILCGKPQRLINKSAIDGNGNVLIYFYHEKLRQNGKL